MKIGALIFATDYAVRIDELAKELEARGFESLFVPEHTHIPTSRLSPYPGGGDLPQEYINSYDPFVSLSFAAAATSKLKIGTGICLLPQRDTIATAKSVASLDHLSAGRFLFGIGGGWNKEEMAQHGIAYEQRFARMREQVLAMKSLWTEDVGEFQGDHVNIEPSWLYPKPVSQPYPPVLLGGETDYTLRRVIDYCDGWLPRGARGADLLERIARLRELASEAGRDMSTISINVFGAKPDAEYLETLRAAGVERCLLGLPSADRDKVFSILDRYQPLLDTFKE
jgi:probable F420-dependent oxidoreductase